MATLPAALAIAPDLAGEHALYPCSDGRPMADNMWQAAAITAAASDLRTALPDPLVAEDILLYPEDGKPEIRIGPDVLVAFGVGRHKRSSYLAWLEGKPPDWVLEVASPGTARRDLTVKREAYARMGVPEYWLFDPKGDIYPEGEAQLQGLALTGRRYRHLRERVEDGRRMIRSKVLGLDLRVENELIRFRDPVTRQDVRHRAETEAGYGREAARADAEAARADAEAARAAAADARANAEAKRRQAAEARLAEMAATVERLRRR